MPRKPRNFEVGGIYHITKRGVNGTKTFLSKQDYSRFILSLEFFNTEKETDLWNSFFYKKSIGGAESPMLGEIIAEKRRERRKEDRIVEILVFCLMPNHFHLILREIKEGGISFFMNKIGGYSSYFNNNYKRSGSLFDRYHSVQIETEEQLIVTFCYAHTNPVELWEPGWKDFKVKDPKSAVKKLYGYRESSFLDYARPLGKPNYPSVTDRDFYLDFFGGTEKCKEAVENWILNKSQP